MSTAAKDLKKINNEITESYCSFEVSKLLKEKGFDIPTVKQYTGGSYQFDAPDSTKCPSHALAIEWIRQNFDIWIFITTDFILYDAEINDFKNSKTHKIISYMRQEPTHTTPQAATDAALLYTLKNLIP